MNLSKFLVKLKAIQKDIYLLKNKERKFDGNYILGLLNNKFTLILNESIDLRKKRPLNNKATSY